MAEIKIVVARFGFIYVGYVERKGDEVRVTQARAIISWGATKGLEELADGPTSNTKLSAPCTRDVPYFGVVSTMEVDQAAWAKVLK